MTSKVDGLHKSLEELHARLEKVETAAAGDEAAEPEYNIFEGVDV